MKEMTVLTDSINVKKIVMNKKCENDEDNDEENCVKKTDNIINY